MRSQWDPDAVVVTRFCLLVRSGNSVRSAARTVGLPLSVAYRLAHEHQLPVTKKTQVTPREKRDITRLWHEGLTPMDIARSLSVSSSAVYRIGIELGLWRRNPHGRKAAATSRRCAYLLLRAEALGRKDAALACGIHPRDVLDIDKGLIKLGDKRIPFVPDGPDTALYNRLMQVLSYVDGRVAVPVQVIS